GVEGRLGEHVDFVDDVDLVPRPLRPGGDAIAQLPDLVHAVVAGPVDLLDVHVLPLGDGLAALALVARGRGRAHYAVEARGQDAGRRRLADPADAGEQVGVGHAAGLDGVGQCPGDRLLADEILELLRPVPPGDNSVLLARVGRGSGRR